jgi:two-component system alkaline phosphatase synthesis response regulator PhoP
MARILVVDDDSQILTALRNELEPKGHHVDTAEDGGPAITLASESRYDLLILDLGLPKVHGYDVCTQLRKNGHKTPILILSQRSTEREKIDGLDAGGDDYLVKPFSPDELQAHVRALLRRGASRANRGAIHLGNVKVDLDIGEVRRGEQRESLTGKEIKILSTLLDGNGSIFTRKQLLDSMSEDIAVTERSVDEHIYNLRRKIENTPSQPVYILSVRGLGYRVRLPDEKVRLPDKKMIEP